MIYKITIKIISSSLFNHLYDIIHLNQATFIPNRSIQDNVITIHEIMRYWDTKKGVKGYMAMKVDLVKAYDRVEWGILRQIIL